MVEHVSCYRCGNSFEFAERKRCTCGEPLWFSVDARGFEWGDFRDEPGLWRYANLLPVSEPIGLASAAGGTPLLRTSRLDDFAGCTTYVSDEGENPTGSFKDRGSAVGITNAVRKGADAVGTVSHGNMAMSVAAHAAAADLNCVVLVPDDISDERMAIIDQYGPNIVRVSGSYGQLYYDSLEIGSRVGVEFVNSDTPLRVAGQKTTALEIFERFAPKIPDAIVLPVSSGGHASAVWKAVCELDEAGLLTEIPPLYFVQAAACAPIAEAFESGADEVSAVVPGETIAYSIANPDPPSGNRALAAARATDGAVVGVTDDEIRDATARLANRVGLCVEIASATSLAGARRLANEGVVNDNDDVVLVATGTGFKESTGHVTSDADYSTVALSDLEATLQN